MQKDKKVVHSNQEKLNDKNANTYFPPNLQQNQFEGIRKAYKNISKFLIYLFKRITFIQLQQTSKFSNQLARCLEILDVILKSLKQDNSCHLFPLFSYVMQKYKKLNKIGEVKKQRIKKRVQLNKLSCIYVEQKLLPISVRQLNLLKSSSLSCISKQIGLNEIMLQNPQCVCCSQVFIKNLQIFNFNPYFPMVIQMDTQNSVDKITIQKYVNAVCNKGGGVIILGAHNLDGVLKTSGIKFKGYEEIQKKKAEICQAIQWIHPPCMYLVEHILVHTNYTDLTNVGEQAFRVCFRIIIFPAFSSKINYLEIFFKGQQRSYEIYYFNELQKLTRLIPGQMNNTKKQYLYTLIHKNYKKKQKKRNSHANIMCYRPYLYCSKSFITLYSQGKISEEEMFPKSEFEDVTVTLSDEPKFKYKNCSLLIVNNKSKTREIDNFTTQLQEEQYQIDILKPFQKSFKENAARLICFLSHDISESELRNNLIRYEQEQIVEKSIIKLLPVSTVLQIEQSKFCEEREQVLRKKFSERYKQHYKCEEAESLDKKVKGEIKQLRFCDKAQSLFAYLVLEQLQIRPFFVKEGYAHKKK